MNAVSASRASVLRSLAALVLGLMIAGGVLVGVAAPSQAHSQEVASDPDDKSKVTTVPDAVTLTFNENVLGVGSRVKVTGPDGDVTDGAATVTDNVVRQAVTVGAPAGKYTVQWRVTSADGHPVSGEFTFSAARASGSAEETAAPGDASPSITPENIATPTGLANASGVGSPDSTSGADDGGISGITVIGIAAIVLAVLIALSTAASRLARSRRGE